MRGVCWSLSRVEAGREVRVLFSLAHAFYTSTGPHLWLTQQLGVQRKAMTWRQRRRRGQEAQKMPRRTKKGLALCVNVKGTQENFHRIPERKAGGGDDR